MPRLDELKRRLKAPKPPAAAMSKTNGRGGYKLSVDGANALMFVGRHRGKNLTQIYKSDPGYLEWLLLRSSFPMELKDVAAFILDGFGVTSPVRLHEKRKEHALSQGAADEILDWMMGKDLKERNSK